MVFSRFRESRQWSQFALGVGVGALLALGLFFLFSWLLAPQPNARTYQAVFLANGQVYFGKLHGVRMRSLRLDDVFYLQANESLQQGGGSRAGATGTPGEATPPAFSLMKLGQSELHSPEDRLYLTKTQVLFWENLRPDSQVIKTIQEYKTQQK